MQETPIQREFKMDKTGPCLYTAQYSLIVRTSPNEKDIKESVLSDPVSVA